MAITSNIIRQSTGDPLLDRTIAVLQFIANRIYLEPEYGLVDVASLPPEDQTEAVKNNALLTAYFTQRQSIFNLIKARRNTDPQFQLVLRAITGGTVAISNPFSAGNLPTIFDDSTEADIFDFTIVAGLDIYVGNTPKKSPSAIGVTPSAEWVTFWNTERTDLEGA